MLVKLFTDDLSWQMQRELTNSYFKIRRYKIVFWLRAVFGIMFVFIKITVGLIYHHQAMTAVKAIVMTTFRQQQQD